MDLSTVSDTGLMFTRQHWVSSRSMAKCRLKDRGRHVQVESYRISRQEIAEADKMLAVIDAEIAKRDF
jgi:hypothetical protein